MYLIILKYIALLFQKVGKEEVTSSSLVNSSKTMQAPPKGVAFVIVCSMVSLADTYYTTYNNRHTHSVPASLLKAPPRSGEARRSATSQASSMSQVLKFLPAGL